MQSHLDSVRYPATPQTNALEEAMREAEKRAYMIRLRNDTFFDLELSQCQTLDEVLQLNEKRSIGIKIHENGLNFRESKKLADFVFYSDADDYQGIPVSVELDHKVAAAIIKQQQENSYKVQGQEEFYTQKEWELREDTIEDLEDQVQDVLTDTSGMLQVLNKDFSVVKVGNTPSSEVSPTHEDLSNTEYLYDLAKDSTWKTMLDFQGYVLPGTGDPYKTCGTWRFSKCREHNYGKRIVHSCNRLSCSTCVQKAGQRIAKKIERRIWLYRLMIQKTTNQKRNDKPSHVVESIPTDDIFWSWSKSKQQRVLKEMRKIAGIRGGVSVTHYWRFKDGKTNPYVSIHNHLICFGWISETAKSDIYKKFGVNVVYHKPKKGTLHERKNVFSVVYYLLSHCAIKNHKHSVHWFGDLSYRKVQNSYLKKFRDEDYLLEDIDIEKSKSCNLCGELLVPAKINKYYHNWQGFMPDPEDMDNGCMFPDGLLAELDFLSEKMEFYGSDYEIIFHKTKRELDEERNLLIYSRKTDSMVLDDFN